MNQAVSEALLLLAILITAGSLVGQYAMARKLSRVIGYLDWIGKNAQAVTENTAIIINDQRAWFGDGNDDDDDDREPLPTGPKQVKEVKIPDCLRVVG